MAKKDLWTNEFLDEMRELGDPLADRTVEKIFHADDVSEILTELFRADDILRAKLPEEIHDYFLEAVSLPPWVNPEKVEACEKLALAYGFTSSTLLACASLPECYIMRNGVEVLGYTRDLQDHTKRRVLETAQMVMDVMSPGGIIPKKDGAVGMGVRAAAKVRLIHAAIRYLLSHQKAHSAGAAPQTAAHLFCATEWDPAAGLPINQEDMAYTLMTFSYVAVRGLEQIVSLTPEQREAYIHGWNVIGYIMGVREDLLPDSFEEARFLFETSKNRQKGETETGREMTKALLDFLEDAMPLGCKHLPHMLICQYVDAETTRLLGVEPPNVVEKLVMKVIRHEWKKVAKGLEHLYDRYPFSTLASVWLHERILEHWGKLRRDGRFNFPGGAREWLLPRIENVASTPGPGAPATPPPKPRP